MTKILNPKILFAIVIAVAMVGGFFIWRLQSSISTSAWKTYRNEKYGFEIRYPSTWFIQLDEGPILIASVPREKNLEGLGPAKHPNVNIAKVACRPTNGFELQGLLQDHPEKDILEKIICEGEFQITLQLANNDPDRYRQEKILETIANSFNLLPDISTWQTYRNEKYGYEIGFPKEWVYLTCLGDTQFFLYIDPNKKENCDAPRGLYDIDIIGPGSPPGNIYDSKSSSTIFVNGLNAVRYFDVPVGQDITANSKLIDIVVVNRSNDSRGIYSIGLPRKSEIADQILSTFRFIEPLDISTWQAYRNEKYGFEFKYPTKIFSYVDTKEKVYASTTPVWNSIFVGTAKNGYLSIVVSDQVLDPNNIQNIYGKANTSTTFVGERMGYSYFVGDGGCAAFVTKTDLGRKTLNISFNQCDEGQNIPLPIYEDKQLIDQILSTFKFIPSTPLGTGVPSPTPTLSPKPSRCIDYYWESPYQGWSVEQEEAHCKNLGGTFRSCGDTCGNRNEPGILACQPTCRL